MIFDFEEREHWRYLLKEKRGEGGSSLTKEDRRSFSHE